MIHQTDTTLQEVLSQASSMEAIKLLPWCISAVVPFCYISRAATMAVQQDEGASIMFGPQSHCTWARALWLTSSGSIQRSISSTSNFPSTHALLSRYSHGRYSLVEVFFCRPPSHSFKGKARPPSQWFTQPSSCKGGPASPPQKLRLEVSTAACRGMTIHPI